MDYEKKYKEALKDMRAIYPNLKGDAKLAVEHAFPELAESEDERIRKGIIEIIKVVSGPDCDVYLNEKKQEKYLAWLEKQKEQKPAEYLSKEKVYAIMKKLTSLSFCVPLGSDEGELVWQNMCGIKEAIEILNKM